MISIFDLERRFDLDIEYPALFDLLDSTKIQIENTSIKLIDLINKTFHRWPYNETAIDIDHYFGRLFEDYYDYDNLSDIEDNTERLYVIDFIINYLDWINNDEFLKKNIDTKLLTKKINKVINLINYILEKLNYTTRKGDEHIYIIKRDENLDSILSVVKEKNLRETLLSFYDFRIQNNVDEKSLILKKIGDYLEPKRKEFNSYNKTLTECIFNLLNKLKIRHFDNHQKELSDEEYLIWYDKLFKMMIHLIRTSEIISIQQEAKELCGK